MTLKPRQNMPSNKRRDYILENGAKLATQIGVENVNPRLVSAICPISTSIATIRLYFKSSKNLRDQIKKSRFYSNAK